MLSKNTARLASRASVRVQSRSFFDYLAELQRQNNPNQTTTTTQQERSTSFTWEFLEYFKKHEPEKAADYEKDKSKAVETEQWLSRAAVQGPNIDFDKWRSRISDPAFVDRLENELKAHTDYWSKWKTYEQTNEWSEEAWSEERQLDFSFQKLDPREKDLRTAKEIKADELMIKHRELLEEIKLDYEQLEAERDLYGAGGDNLSFALHPQLAELSEEIAAGTQTFHDFVMNHNDYQRYTKWERLAQAQNENRRQIFLDRYKQFSYLRGVGKDH